MLITNAIRVINADLASGSWEKFKLFMFFLSNYAHQKIKSLDLRFH